MTNEEKYTTPDERVKAFSEFCRRHNQDCSRDRCFTTSNATKCAFSWLTYDVEEEKPEPCPFCHGNMQSMVDQNNDTHCLVCYGGCGYTTGAYASEAEAVKWHNRVARAVKAYKESEVRDGK